MAANESSAVASIRTITVGCGNLPDRLSDSGLATALTNLGGAVGAACLPSSTTACLIDSVLSNNGNPAGGGKSGYTFATGATGAGTVVGGVNSGYTVLATPLSINQTFIRAFCAEEDAAVRRRPRRRLLQNRSGLTFNLLNQ